MAQKDGCFILAVPIGVVYNSATGAKVEFKVEFRDEKVSQALYDYVKHLEMQDKIFSKLREKYFGLVDAIDDIKEQIRHDERVQKGLEELEESRESNQG